MSASCAPRVLVRSVGAVLRPRFALVPAALLAAAILVPQASAASAIGVKLTVKPKKALNSTTATFAWTTHGKVLRTLCARDHSRFQVCKRHRTYTGLKNGLHTFRVEAVGPTSKWITSYRFRVDTILPTAPVATGGSSAWQNVASIAITAAGSTDSGSGLAGYQRRSSTDGGVTWSAGTAGGLVTASADGETLVQFRALDRAGNASAWSPAAAAAGATARIDRDLPTPPLLTGGSVQWQNRASVDILASGSTDVGAGVDHYEYRTSVDGGTTWSPAVVGGDASISDLGETLVQMRAVDGAGNVSLWAPLIPDGSGTVRLDRTIPTAPDVSGATTGWENIAGTTLTASGSVDSVGSGVAGYEYRTSTDGGASWSPASVGATLGVSAEGETLVEFRSVDNTSLTSAWTSAPVRIDRTNPADPTVGGGSPAWQSVPSVDLTGSGSTDAGGSGLAGYEFRSSTDGGSTWSAANPGGEDLVTAEGETLVEMRAVDGAGNGSNWVQDVARIDRSSPTVPAVSGGSLAWQSVASVLTSAAGSTDAGGSGLVGYEYRSSTDGGTTWAAAASGASLPVSSEGQTLVEFRAVDGAGNSSAWEPAAASAGSTVRIDRTVPTLGAVSGGSLTWKNQASTTITAVGGTDDGGGSGFAGYEHRTSTDGGSTWSAASAGASLVVSAQGETLVQFRALDGAGNTGAWVPASSGAANTVRLDRTAPTAPSVAGGSPAWQSVPSLSLTASGSADGDSGLAGYQYRTSTDGGSTWSAFSAGAAVVISGQGTTNVEFRAVDGVGLASAWVQDAVHIDRTAPGAPTLSGGSSTWRSLASVGVIASGGTDSGGAGVAGYQSRTSTDSGATWSVPAAGASVTISAAGETLVQFRTMDGAGNVSGWAPAAGFTGTVRLDHSVPTDPIVSGGSLAWQSVASATLSAAGSTDSGGASLAGYQVRTSTDAGATWSAAAAGSSLPVSAEGETLVGFRAIDGAGNVSGWVQGVVRLDRTAPGTPTVSGGSLAWQNVASVTISGAGASDSGGSGLSGYELRSSTDGGATWSAAAPGASSVVSAEGETLVQLRSVDGAGNHSAWKPAAPGTTNTARIDRTAPSAPAVSGGSPAWQSVASVLVSASASTDSPGSGVAGYQYQTSTDNGVTWSSTSAGSSLSVAAQGETLVQFEAVDTAGFVSSPTQATVRIDRTLPTAPAVSGGSSAWQNVASVTVSASGSTDGGGSALSGYQYRTSTDNGATWSAAVAGASDVVSAEGQTLVQLRSIDGAGNVSAWTPAAAGASNTARIDRTAPSVPMVTGGSPAWQSVASIATSAAAAADPGGSGVTGYELSTSTNGGLTWSAAAAGSSLVVSAEGETLVEYRSVDAAGNRSAWVQATARIDRTAPTAPVVSGGSLVWQSVASVTISAAGSIDSGGSLLSGYRYRSSTNGGTTWSSATAGASDTISVEGGALVQFQAVDGAGNSSAWAPAVSGAANTVRIDRALPVAPTSVSGGSLSWQSVASVTITPAGGSDTGSGFAGYDYRTSTNGGTSWSTATAGNSLAVVAEGTTLVQFRSRDVAGNVSAWTPAAAGAANTAAIDRTAPTLPAVIGGSLTWQIAASVTITASGSTDAMSGLLRYEYRTSTNGGGAWSATSTGPSAAIAAEASTIVQFRAVDNAGNVSAWAPAVAGAGNTVKLDRTAPTLPSVTGGLGAGTCKHKLTVSAAGSIDPLSGVARYDYRLSTNGGSTWAATVTNKTSVALMTTGTYVVQFHVVDVAGNVSAWAPAVAGTANTACVL